VGNEGSKKPCELFLLWLRGSVPGLSGEFFLEGTSLTTCAIEGREKLWRELVLELADSRAAVMRGDAYGTFLFEDMAVTWELVEELLSDEAERECRGGAKTGPVGVVGDTFGSVEKAPGARLIVSIIMRAHHKHI
jgi:hypothetical protein